MRYLALLCLTALLFTLGCRIEHYHPAPPKAPVIIPLPVRPCPPHNPYHPHHPCEE